MNIGFYGFGATGRVIAAELIRRDHTIGAVFDPALAGQTLSALLGMEADPGQNVGQVVVSASAEVFSEVRPGVVVHATPRDTDLVSQILEIVKTQSNVISISGVSHLWSPNPDGAVAIDETARQMGVSVLGTGVNPGFLTDVLPVFLTSTCVQIDAVGARRVSNLSAFGEAVMAACGIGLTPNEFDSQIASGALPLHGEIWQSIGLMTDALGWTAMSTHEEKIGILAERAREGKYVAINPGTVCGYRHQAVAECAEGKRVELEVAGILAPEESDGVAVGTWVWIKGHPGMHVALSGDISERPAGAVAGRVANLIPWVFHAAPGLRRLCEIPVGEGARGAGGTGR